MASNKPGTPYMKEIPTNLECRKSKQTNKTKHPTPNFGYYSTDYFSVFGCIANACNAFEISHTANNHKNGSEKFKIRMNKVGNAQSTMISIQ